MPEVLITILLISILFALGVIFVSGSRSSKKMRNYEIAIALAQQALEAVRAAPFATLDDADAGDNSLEKDLNTSSNGVDLFEPVFVANQVKYERKVEIEDVPAKNKDGTPVRLKHVRVVVQWIPPDGEKTTYEITTTVSDIN